jgi:methionyl-tRNA synthetase
VEEPTEVSIEAFQQVDLRTAKIVAAEQVKGTQKLLRLVVDIGSEQREIVSGIADYYTPESLVGKTIIVIVNLKPAKIRGVESRGMLLAATRDERLVLLTSDNDIPPGSKIS